VKRETVLQIVEAVEPPLGQQTPSILVFRSRATVGLPCVFIFGFRSRS